MKHEEYLSPDLIRSWPKAELHSHLDGAMRLETMLEMAADQGKMSLLPAQTLEGLEVELAKVDDSRDLWDYLAWFKYTIGLMQTPEALTRVAQEMALDFAARKCEIPRGPIRPGFAYSRRPVDGRGDGCSSRRAS